MIKTSFLFLLLMMMSCQYTVIDNIKLFPLENYSQDLDVWFNEKDPHFHNLVMSVSTQNDYYHEFLSNYYGTDQKSHSAWSPFFIQTLIHPDKKMGKSIFLGEKTIIDHYISEQNNYLGMNFRPYPMKRLNGIQDNMNIESFKNLNYSYHQRAIVVGNTQMRILPTMDPWFRARSIAGEGYPFDYNSVTSLYIGTPIYILGESRNKAWSLVSTNMSIGWVSTSNIRRVSSPFVNTWQKAAYKKLGSISQFLISLLESHQQFYHEVYLGTLFPIVSDNLSKNIKIMIPLPTSSKGVKIGFVSVKQGQIVTLPLSFTRANLKKVISECIGKPYGWGNRDFYQDCSSELKLLYSQFGIFLANNSYNQSFFGSEILDLSALTPIQRYQALAEKGIPLLTFIYVKGHIILYLGAYENKNHHQELMSYQNVWGLKPKDNAWRSILGGAIIFPLKLEYPEEKSLSTYFSKPYFKLIFFDRYTKSPTLGLSQLLY